MEQKRWSYGQHLPVLVYFFIYKILFYCQRARGLNLQIFCMSDKYVSE